MVRLQVSAFYPLARDFRRVALAVSLALAWLIPADAAAYSARVRWSPSSGAVTGYEVYKRAGTGGYGNPEPGTPASSGGVLSLVVASLDARTDYTFRVRAVGTGGGSAFSNELRIGYAEVAPVVDSDGDGLKDGQEDANLNRVVDAGESDPTRTDSDSDGVGDLADTCEGTAGGAAVSGVGCSCAQVTCGDGNACNGAEACTAGVCRAGTALVCNDGNPCTTDGCNPASGCTTTPISGCASCTSASQCNDNNPCTTNACSNGMCQFAAVSNGTACSDANLCNGAETCQSGTCSAGTAPVCNDGNPCTTDACNPTTGCTTTPISGCASCTSATQCNDNNPCTTNACSNGMCQFTAVSNGTACSDTNLCNGAETCQSGTCRAGTPLNCADTNACTADSCNPTAGCVRTNVAEGTACGIDRGFCGGRDSCRAGVCTAGTAPNCSDGNSCTTDACDSTLGRCTHQSRPGCCQTNTDCADSNACTTAERCSGGTCVSTPLACPNPGQCAVGRCDSFLGCASDPLPDGTPCDDGNRCTRSDACSAGVCGAAPRAAADETGDSEMTVHRLAVRQVGEADQRIRGRATLPGGAELELDRAGLSLQIEDALGTQLYGVDVPGSAFLPQTRAASSRISMRPGTDPNLRRLAVSVRGDDVAVRFTIVGDGLVPTDSEALTLKVNASNGCGRWKTLTCTAGRTGTTCR